MSDQYNMSGFEPALQPPEGVVADFDNPKDVVHTIGLVTEYLAVIFITVAVVLRMFVRLKIQKSFNKEDFCCLLAWILTIGWLSAGILMSLSGGGYHRWELSQSQLRGFLKAQYASMVMYGPATLFIKITLLLVYARVFAPYHTTVLFIYIFMGAMLAYYIPVQVIKVRLCDPISKNWNEDQRGSCLDQHGVFVADTVMSSVIDLVILIIPMPLIGSLQMPLQKKIKILALLAAGGAATIASIARLVMVVQIGGSADNTLTGTQFNLLGVAEAAIGLICACLPAISVLVACSSRQICSIKKPNRSQTSDDVELAHEHAHAYLPSRPPTRIQKTDEVELIRTLSERSADSPMLDQMGEVPWNSWEPKREMGFTMTVIKGGS